MLMYPSVRKGLITEPTSAPFANPQDFIHIQGDYCVPDFSSEQYSHQSSPRLLSPFQYQPDYQFFSPPSSVPSSPTFSSPSSISHRPSTSVTDRPAAFDGYLLEAPSMTPATSDNPSTSQSYLPQYPEQYLFDTSMLAQPTVANSHSWEGNLQSCKPAPVHNGLPRVSHQKASPNLFSNRSVPTGNSHGINNHTVPKPLPTPVQTPVQNSFLAPSFQTYDQASQDGNPAETEMAMQRAVMEQQQSQPQHRPSDYSLAPSASSVSHNSPVTPQTNLDDLNDASKTIANGEDRYPGVDRWMEEYLRFDALPEYGNQNGNSLSMAVPKLNRTISDIYQDELYNPSIMPVPHGPKQPTSQNLLGPFRNVFADRLQAASQGHISARSQSPGMALNNRERSPFRQTSHLAAEFNNPTLQQPQLPTSMPVSQGGLDMGQQNNEPKTISPKDALLDYKSEETSMPPLFSSNQPDFNLGDALGLRRESSSSFRPPQSYSTMESFPAQYATHVTHQQYPFAQQQQGQQQSQHLLNQSPEFHGALSNLEPSNGGMGAAADMTSSQGPSMVDIQSIRDISRPDDTSSDGGTYTCTYHGCTLRFETPSKLQKHKREAHRQTTPGGHLVNRDATSLRNSQAGPHRCERINPSTGKPCNSVFSRPYDLTRHEDTIHNARKQKVRCHLCTEEKTFSRNDALTRHMRVVHPEVDWPGKQRRRGRD